MKKHLLTIIMFVATSTLMMAQTTNISVYKSARSIEIERAYSHLFFEMETDFSLITGKKPRKEEELQSIYDNSSITIPNVKSSYIVETKNSGVRFLNADLNIIADTEEGGLQLTQLLDVLKGLTNYKLTKYHTDSVNTYYSIFKSNELIGVITFHVEGANVSFNAYPLVQAHFMSDLRKVIIEGITNNFINFKGEPAEMLAENQRISTFHFYQTGFSIYSDLGNNNYCHQSFFRDLPALVLHNLIGGSKSKLQNMLGFDYTVLQNFNETDLEKKLSSQIIVIGYLEKTIYMEVNYFKGSQIISFVVGNDFSSIKKKL